jgi:5-methyltetrahydrofolate--homocysteine methyltransferase
MDKLLVNIYNGIIDGERDVVRSNVQKAIDANLTPDVILKDGMIAAMTEVGRRFEVGDYYVPEMLIAARAMKEGMALLKPCLRAANIQAVGKVAAGTVKGDLHDIGKNLVCMMLEGAGFEIIDLGNDVSPDRFVQTIRESRVDIVAMSALLTTTMASMRETISAIEAAGLRDKVKIMVGGAPLTDAYAKQIGADGFSADANQAVILARSLVGAA